VASQKEYLQFSLKGEQNRKELEEMRKEIGLEKREKND
jgi:hypothetical protein